MASKPHATSPHPAQFRERAVQVVVDRLESYGRLNAAVRDIAQKLGSLSHSLRVWDKPARRDAGEEAGCDAGKRINGRKRHLPCDTLGLMIRIDAHSA
jgi:transposase-like protein